MSFSSADLDGFLAALGAVPVVVKFKGATLKTIQGVFRRSSEMLSPFDADRLVTTAAVRCKDSDAGDLTRDHTLTVDGTEYRIYGEPRPSEAGTVLIGLTKK